MAEQPCLRWSTRGAMIAAVCSLLAVCLMGRALPAGEKGAKDLKAMQGEWTMVALEVNGQNVPIAKLEGTNLTIKGDLYVVKVKDRDLACKITLDPGHDPRHMEMVFVDGDKKDKTHKAIYRIDGDKLQVARGLNADQERPNQFATWPDTGYFVVTWQKK